MIIVYHLNNKVVELTNASLSSMAKMKALTLSQFLVDLASENPTKLLVWCHISLKEQLNISEIKKLFHHKKLVFSFNTSNALYIDSRVGYVEESPYLKISKTVPFSTWQMSSMVGGMYAEVLNAIKNEIFLDKDFDYFLCSIAKMTMKKGLLCYSEPKLLKKNYVIDSSLKTNIFTLFRFVKQHYKTKWVFLLLLNIVISERKIPFFPFLISLFYKRRNNKNINLEGIAVQSSRKVVSTKTIDVIIPTIGRKDFLKDFLKDLSIQTHLPNRIIVVEQNPIVGSKSELEYIQGEKWPFEIKHLFIHQAGACNARNLALKEIDSEWVFFADDDIRIEPNFLEKALEKCTYFGSRVVSFSCLQKDQVKIYNSVFQWVAFGSGCSLVFSESLIGCEFKMGYEFGYGEDGDFGMQLRNKGYDILYLPEPEILHLKAPIGGFRTKPQLQWEKESIHPKPSPTILLYFTLHYTKEQILGYKTILFFKNYNFKSFQNPIQYCRAMNKQWKVSEYWANKLRDN